MFRPVMTAAVCPLMEIFPAGVAAPVDGGVAMLGRCVGVRGLDGGVGGVKALTSPLPSRPAAFAVTGSSAAGARNLPAGWIACGHGDAVPRVAGAGVPGAAGVGRR